MSPSAFVDFVFCEDKVGLVLVLISVDRAYLVSRLADNIPPQHRSLNAVAELHTLGAELDESLDN